MMRWLLAGCLMASMWVALAGPLALPAVPHPEFFQQPSARLPLSLVFNDDSGASVTLGSYFTDRPVLLLLGYYHCPNLCSTVTESMLDALARARLPRNAYRLVEVSIDPHETPELAGRKKMSYEPLFGSRGADLHLLTGKQSAIASLSQAVGFRYVYDEQQSQYLHPAGFVVATPDGRVSRYFLGVSADPDDLRTALRQASANDIGSPVERLLLLCSHYDPATGRYSVAVMTLVRIVCFAVLLALSIWMWRRRAVGEKQQ